MFSEPILPDIKNEKIGLNFVTCEQSRSVQLNIDKTERYTESYLANETIMNQLVSQRKRRVLLCDWRGQLSVYFIIHP